MEATHTDRVTLEILKNYFVAIAEGMGYTLERTSHTTFIKESADFVTAVATPRGEFFAYLNHCPHMGGPACQGKMIAKVEEVIAEDRTSKGMMFSKSKMHVVCPWHGFEFDIRTGIHPGNPRARLRKMKVAVALSAGNGKAISMPPGFSTSPLLPPAPPNTK